VPTNGTLDDTGASWQESPPWNPQAQGGVLVRLAALWPLGRPIRFLATLRRLV